MRTKTGNLGDLANRSPSLIDSDIPIFPVILPNGEKAYRMEQYPSAVGRLVQFPISDEACGFKASLKVG